MPRPSLGLICQPGLEAVVARSTALDVVEIEPQVSWLPSRGADSVLDSGPVRAACAVGAPLLLHSVGLPVGGTVPIDVDQVRLIRELAAHLECPWVSEHLSILRIPDETAGDVSTGVLLAPPPTAGAVEVAAANICRLSAAIERPVIFETAVNYLRPRRGEMPDGEFFAAVAERADCGILVDLHNLWCNELNGRQTVQQVMDRLPARRVREIHVASGYWRGDHYLDAHCGLTEPPVIEVLERALDAFPAVEAVVFEVSPDRLGRAGLTIDAVVDHLDELAAVVHRSTPEPAPLAATEPAPASRGDRVSPRVGDGATMAATRSAIDDIERWEAALGGIVLDRPASSDLASALADDPGSRVWRDIALASRRGQFAGALPTTCRLLLMHLGPDRLLELLGDVWVAHPVGRTNAEEAHQVARHIERSCSEIPYVSDVLQFELALHDLVGSADPEPSIQVSFELGEALASIAAGRIPTGPEPDGGLRHAAGADEPGRPETIGGR